MSAFVTQLPTSPEHVRLERQVAEIRYQSELANRKFLALLHLKQAQVERELQENQL